jgi:hypothetical protein
MADAEFIETMLNVPTRTSPVLPTLPREVELTAVRVLDYGLVPGDKVMRYTVKVIDMFTGKTGWCDTLANECEVALLAGSTNSSVTLLARKGDVRWEE